MATIFSVIEDGKFRACKCGACGNPILTISERTKVCQPWQIRGVNYHTDCLNKFKDDLPKEDRTTIGSSDNCKNHEIVISHLDKIRFQYYLHYGFSRVACGKVRATFENAESIGSTIYVAFESGAEVMVDGEIAHTIEEYDRLTKAVCMR